MGKNVGVGRFMMTDSRFKQDLLDLLPNYEWIKLNLNAVLRNNKRSANKNFQISDTSRNQAQSANSKQTVQRSMHWIPHVEGDDGCGEKHTRKHKRKKGLKVDRTA